jgi:hypothetical protein
LIPDPGPAFLAYTDPDPDPGFDEQKWKKIYSREKKLNIYFFNQKLQFTYP